MANKTAGVNPDYFGEPMTNDTYMIGANLLKTGTLVSFRIVEEEVLPAHDEAEFGMRVLLKFVPEEGEDDQDEDDVAEDTAEWGAFGFMFVLGVLSFDEAKPRNLSTRDYHEKDEFNVADFIERLRFVRGRIALRCRLYSRSSNQNPNRRARQRYGEAGDHRSRQGSIALARAYARKKAAPIGR
jgi:hypothetical protein